ncbi:MAG: glycine--tRNA ligase subunit beta, partial [Desulfobacterales bacterium]|nr:glycine--tRNA ligase subunit beta [Desulfobacterales bacterium]
MDNLLLEIGTEEIPAGYIEPALKSLASALDQRLTEARIDHGPSRVFGTPRRLAVQIDDVAPRQAPLTEEVVGPPERVGFGADGKPTMAAVKFAEKVGVPVNRIRIKETEKGRYLCAIKTERGGSTLNMLKTMLPAAILATPFPKSMRWADLNISFARPIHWILALFGEKTVSFGLGGIRSGRHSCGHRFVSPGRIRIDHSDQYVEALRSACVLADSSERRTQVADQVRRTASALGGKIIEDAELVDIVNNLVEFPAVSAGKFEAKYLEVPDVVLITAMRKHQKYFAVVDADQRLLPCFIAVNNTPARNMDLVARGHERVLRARLEDARFFFQSDLADSMDQWKEKLNGVLFQA